MKLSLQSCFTGAVRAQSKLDFFYISVSVFQINYISLVLCNQWRREQSQSQVYNSLILSIALRMWCLSWRTSALFWFQLIRHVVPTGLCDIYPQPNYYIFSFEYCSQSLRVLNLDFTVRINNVPVATNSVMFKSCLYQSFKPRISAGHQYSLQLQ